MGWWGTEWGGLKVSNFCTYMEYLYCMPKWSHSRFYEIKLLINISIYCYIKFIKTVQTLVLGVTLSCVPLCYIFFFFCQGNMGLKVSNHPFKAMRINWYFCDVSPPVCAWVQGRCWTAVGPLYLLWLCYFSQSSHHRLSQPQIYSCRTAFCSVTHSFSPLSFLDQRSLPSYHH